MLFQKIIPATPPAPITPEIAQDIYGYLKEFFSISSAYEKASKYPFCYFEDVYNEVQALEQVANEEMMSEDMPKDKSDLISRLSSDLLDLEIFATDFIDYIMTYKKNTTREDFVSQFIFLKSQND